MQFAPTIFKPAQVVAALRHISEMTLTDQPDRVSFFITAAHMVEAEITLSAAKVVEERVAAETVGDVIVLAAVAAGFRP